MYWNSKYDSNLKVDVGVTAPSPITAPYLLTQSAVTEAQSLKAVFLWDVSNCRKHHLKFVLIFKRLWLILSKTLGFNRSR